MVTTLIDLQIGSTGESHFDLNEHLTVFHPWNRHPLNLHVLLTIEDRGCHFSIHSNIALPYLIQFSISWLDHDFHGIWLGISRQSQCLYPVSQGESVRNQAAQIHPLTKNKVHSIILQIHRSAIGT